MRRRPRSTSLARLIDSPATRTSPVGRLVEPAEELQQRRLAGPRRADDRDSIALRDFELDAAQHFDLAADVRERLHETDRLEHDRCVSFITQRLGRRLARGAERRIQRREDCEPERENRDLGDLERPQLRGQVAQEVDVRGQ